MQQQNTNASNTDKKYNKGVLDFVPQFIAGLISALGGDQQPLVSPQPQTPPPNQVMGQNIPQTSSQPTPQPQSKGKYDKATIEGLIEKMFPNDSKTAKAVAMQESTLGQNNINPDNPNVVGLFQIDAKAHADKIPGKTYQEKVNNLLDPAINAQVAKQIYDKQGWNPWEAYTSGAYKKYL